MKGIIAVVAIVGALFASAGCSKLREPYNDAPVKSKDDSPAEIYSMPDGFSNFATKCDRHGNRVYAIFHLDRPYGSIAVSPQDPSCR